MLIGLLSFSVAGCDDLEQEIDEILEEADEYIEEVDTDIEDADSDIKDADNDIEDADNDIKEADNDIEEGPCPYEKNAQLIFSTEDIYGNKISTDSFANAKLIMVNFWEPWCGPCVGEMPDIEQLYEEYQSDGFVVAGVFSTPNVDGDVKEVMEYCGTTYPIIRFTESMAPFTTEYVPTTVFMDQHGHVLTDEPFVGSNSYDGWQQIIEMYLNR